MRSSRYYRALLFLYPGDFRRQFSAEMMCVFEQRAAEHGNHASFGFLATEFFNLIKGAYLMSFTTLQTDVTSSTLAPLTFKEAAELRQKAIKNMVAAIAAHDFVNARNYSNEEARLKHLLQDLEEPLTTA